MKQTTRKTKLATSARETTRKAGEPVRFADFVRRTQTEVRGLSWSARGAHVENANSWVLDRTAHEAALRSAVEAIIREAIDTLVHTERPDGTDYGSVTIAAIMLREAALLLDILGFLGREPELAS